LKRLAEHKGSPRINYRVATWVFTSFVYYVFITGGLVTAVQSF
jgi:hypothetical protein